LETGKDSVGREGEGMLIAIRHFPDRKRPCIVLEEGNQALVLGYLTDRKREKWLRMALMVENAYQLAIEVNSLYDLNEIMESEEQE
jgi:hypothetical protein